MKLSTKGRYAVTAMMDLTLHDAHKPVTLAEVARRQGISLSYLEQLFAGLRRHELVEGVRGPGGGYRLARSAEAITMADIIVAVDENIDATRCGGARNCRNGELCLAHDLWSELTCHVYNFLNSMTLAQATRRQGVRELARSQVDTTSTCSG